MNEIKKNLWQIPITEVYKTLDTDQKGLSSETAQKLLDKFGQNKIKKEKSSSAFEIFLNQFKSPLILLLIFATIIAYFIGDIIEASIILTILLLNACLSFFQEYKAEKAFQLLREYTITKSKVLRDNKLIDIDSKNIVVGDIVYLNPGDLVPADLRIINSKNLLVNEAALTGESNPAQKVNLDTEFKEEFNPTQAKHILFMGTSIFSGTASAIVISTGQETYFGQIAQYIQQSTPPTDFQKNMAKFSMLLMKVTILMTLLIFIVNTLQHKSLMESVLFALALAIGITPELLPVIITITLAKGALHMASKKVIVKKLSSVENLGNMDILCSDKTGTITEGIFNLQESKNFDDATDNKLIIYGLLCSQEDSHNNHNGIVQPSNPMDKAIWDQLKINKLESEITKYKILDTAEFDFNRRRASCLVQYNDQKIIILKGSPDKTIPVSTKILMNGQTQDLTGDILNKINTKIENYEKDGVRIILIAAKRTDITKLTIKDETDLTILGYLTFIDPPKKTAKDSLQKIKNLGVQIKIITGDSPIITRKVCKDINLEIIEDKIITGDILEKLSPEESSQYFLKYNIFARITPEQKYNIVKSLNKSDHIVGFLGDGINDSPALKISDVGISVDSAAEIAKSSADIILLHKSLRVLIDGIIYGRKAFGNTTKYILNTISSNFGNMVTITLVSFFIPFLPMLPSQILLSNFITDLTLITISTDSVDPEFTVKPKKWNMSLISKFMIIFGVLSSFFDLFYIIPMLYIIKASPEQFRTGLFILSCLMEIFVTFIIRTVHPFYKSRPSNQLFMTALIMLIVTLVIPFTSLGHKLFEFTTIPAVIFILIAGIVFVSCISFEICKRYFFRKIYNTPPRSY